MMRPNTKPTVGALAGAIVVVLVWILGMFSIAVAADAAAGLVVIVTFVASYLVPERTSPQSS